MEVPSPPPWLPTCLHSELPTSALRVCLFSSARVYVVSQSWNRRRSCRCYCTIGGQTICGVQVGTKSIYSPCSLDVYPTFNPAPQNIFKRPLGKVLELSGDNVESMLWMGWRLVKCWVGYMLRQCWFSLVETKSQNQIYHRVGGLNMGTILSGHNIERMLIWSKFSISFWSKIQFLLVSLCSIFTEEISDVACSNTHTQKSLNTKKLHDSLKPCT